MADFGQAESPTNNEAPISAPSQTQRNTEENTQKSNENNASQLSPSSFANVLVTRPPSRANRRQVDATEISEREARKKIQKEKRMALQREKRRQNRRQNIARELGRDLASIDSDEERKYFNRLGEEDRAEEERRQALSPEERRQEDVQSAARVFERHVNTHLGPHSRLPYPIFLLQAAPESNNEATCQLIHCPERILPRDYRISVDPGSRHWSGSPDLYHIDCFEQLLDLSSPVYASRFQPDIYHFPGHIELEVLKEYIRRWMIRIGLQEPSFPEHIWGASTTEIEPERYFVSETDPNYDERHSLSSALRNLGTELYAEGREDHMV